jgi:hypothetical protein
MNLFTIAFHRHLGSHFPHRHKSQKKKIILLLIFKKGHPTKYRKLHFDHMRVNFKLLCFLLDFFQFVFHILHSNLIF